MKYSLPLPVFRSSRFVVAKSKFQIESYFATENFSHLSSLSFISFTQRQNRIPLNFFPLFHHGNYPVNPSLSFNSISHFLNTKERETHTQIYTQIRAISKRNHVERTNFPFYNLITNAKHVLNFKTYNLPLPAYNIHSCRHLIKIIQS